jgi:hypothetical protein
MAMSRDLHGTKRVSVDKELPRWIYSYRACTSQLHRCELSTGQAWSISLPSFYFKEHCSWSELPGGLLIVSGGGLLGSREVACIDTSREFAVTPRAPMRTARGMHASVYHTHYLYALGGSGPLKGCERYVCAEDRWEVVRPLPVACGAMSGIVSTQSLYALGGHTGTESYLDLIQRLSLESLMWEVLEVRLPETDFIIPSFKVSSSQGQIWFVVGRQLYTFSAQVQLVRPLTREISSCYGPSYYCAGTLYCSNSDGQVDQLTIGDI